jgi:hypothetical protein
MNGVFFTYGATSSGVFRSVSMAGKFVSPYSGNEETWVLSKEPERKSDADYGAVDEFEVILNLYTGAWLAVPQKDVAVVVGNEVKRPVGCKIVDVNVIGSFVDYVVQYIMEKAADIPTRCLYFRDRNVDGIFSTANYSVFSQYENDCANSILGSYKDQETYIRKFNNSVMLYNNLRMVINGNAVMAYSYAVLRQRVGVIFVPFGDLQEDYIPNYYYYADKEYVISKTATGYLRIIRLGKDIPNRIERIAQYVHKINTVDVVNILVEREERVTAEHGSLDWNNKFEIVNGITSVGRKDKTQCHVNSGYNPLYEITGLRSSSMIIDDTSFALYGRLYNQPVEDGYSLKFFNTEIKGNGSIDVYYDAVQPSKYRYSLVKGVQRYNSLFDDQSFPLGVIVPFPVGTRWSMHNEIIAVGIMSRGLMAPGLLDSNKTLGVYQFSRQIYFGEDSFVLFGIQYVFDGDCIYQDSEQIAMAFGYRFMGCDNLAAYFYNPWDKSVYQFTGSRSLTRVLSLTNKSEVKTARYDGFSGEMILLTRDEIIKKRGNVLMSFPYVPGDEVIPTKRGGYVQLADGERILLSPLGGEVDFFEIVTEFIGVDGSTVCDYERVDIRLFSPDKRSIDFTVELQTINQDTKESERKKIELKANEWSSDGYKTIKLMPQYKKGTGLSLRIYSGDEMFVTGIEFTYERIGRTANSQRTGY